MTPDDAVTEIVAWADGERRRLETTAEFLAWLDRNTTTHNDMVTELSTIREPQPLMCDVCEEPFLEGEAMVDVPAIGWMHQLCKSPWAHIVDGYWPEGEDG